jgi:HEAT repeat protein
VRIAEALRKICRQAELAVPGLQRLLMDKDGRVRSAAASALAGFRSQAEPAVPTLIAIVREGDRYAEDDAVMALGCVGPPAKAAVPVLIEALKRTGDLGLPDVVNALGSIGPDARDAVPALQALLRRESEYVRSAVRSALNNICPEPEEHSMPNEVTAAAAFLDRDLKGGQPSAPRGPQSPDPPGEPTYEGKTLAQWVAQLNSQDDGAREEAIDAIGRFGRKASVAVPALERLAKDENELIRVAAQEALKVIRGAK